MSLTEPIVEGAWYLRSDFSFGPAVADGDWMSVLEDTYYDDGTAHDDTTPWLVRRIGYLVHTDPAEVVAELTARSEAAYARQTAYDEGYHRAVSNAYESAADLVEAKLGVK